MLVQPLRRLVEVHWAAELAELIGLTENPIILCLSLCALLSSCTLTYREDTMQSPTSY